MSSHALEGTNTHIHTHAHLHLQTYTQTHTHTVAAVVRLGSPKREGCRAKGVLLGRPECGGLFRPDIRPA